LLWIPLLMFIPDSAVGDCLDIICFAADCLL